MNLRLKYHIFIVFSCLTLDLKAQVLKEGLKITLDLIEENEQTKREQEELEQEIQEHQDSVQTTDKVYQYEPQDYQRKYTRFEVGVGFVFPELLRRGIQDFDSKPLMLEFNYYITEREKYGFSFIHSYIESRIEQNVEYRELYHYRSRRYNLYYDHSIRHKVFMFNKKLDFLIGAGLSLTHIEAGHYVTIFSNPSKTVKWIEIKDRIGLNLRFQADQYMAQNLKVYCRLEYVVSPPFLFRSVTATTVSGEEVGFPEQYLQLSNAALSFGLAMRM